MVWCEDLTPIFLPKGSNEEASLSDAGQGRVKCQTKYVVKKPKGGID